MASLIHRWKLTENANDVAWGNTGFASSTYHGYSASYVFNGTIPGWNNASNSGALEYIGVLLPVAKVVKCLSILSTSGRCLGTFNFQGSNNTTNGTDGTWTNIATGLVHVSVAEDSGRRQQYLIPNTNSYTSYRCFMTAYTSIPGAASIQMFDGIPGTYDYGQSPIMLTNNGGVTFSIDGASFNGLNQWLSGTYNIPANATMSCWIKPTVWTKAMCLMYSFHAASTGVGMGASVAGVLAGEVTGQSISAGANSFTSVLFPSNQWTLVTFSAGSIAALYRGASLIGTAAITPTASGSSSFALGAYGGTNYSNFEFQGKMIDARIYDYALSAPEVAALAAAGPNPSAGPLRFAQVF